MQESALSFYGDGRLLEEVYGNKGETLDEAAAKFHNSNTFANLSDKQQIHLSYDEAKQRAHGGKY